MLILKSCCILISNLKGYIVEELLAFKIWSFCQIVNSSFWYLFVAFHWFLTQSLEPTIWDKCDINFYVLLSALPYDRLLQMQPLSADVSDHIIYIIVVFNLDNYVPVLDNLAPIENITSFGQFCPNYGQLNIFTFNSTLFDYT